MATTAGLVGVYAGRDHNGDGFEAELGRVWRADECLIPILESAKKQQD